MGVHRDLDTVEASQYGMPMVSCGHWLQGLDDGFNGIELSLEAAPVTDSSLTLYNSHSKAMVCTQPYMCLYSITTILDENQ